MQRAEHSFQHQLNTDRGTNQEKQEQCSQIPEHRLYHIVAFQDGNHQGKLIKLSVGHTKSRAHHTYRLVLILKFDIDGRIIEDFPIMASLFFGDRKEFIERHQRAFRFKNRGVVKRMFH